MVQRMDSVSQALFGGLAASAFSRNTNMRQAFVLGAIGGSLPDLDAWAGGVIGPLQERLWHRGPTHSLLLLGCVGLCIWAAQKHSPSSGLLKAHNVWVGAFTHPLLDILTGFETSWGYPIFEPSALGWFPVLEPLALLILLGGTARYLWTKDLQVARSSLVILGVWVGVIGSYHYWVSNAVRSESPPLKGVERVVIRPMLGSFLSYRVVWIGANQCYVAGLQPFEDTLRWSRVASFPRVVQASDFPNLLLEQGCFINANDREMGDLRFALTPDSPMPLWLWTRNGMDWARRAERVMSPELRTKFMSLWIGEKQVGWTSAPRLVEP